MMRFVGPLAVALCLCAVPSPRAHAQIPPRSSIPLDGMRLAVLRGITLTPAQDARVDTIAHTYHMRMRAMQSEMERTGPNTRRRTLRDLADRQAREIRGVLTPAQQQQFDRNLAEYQRARSVIPATP